MSDLPRQRIEIDAPAKLNLGLEVIGRREDGFHEIATIFLAIDLCDRLELMLEPPDSRRSALTPLPPPRGYPAPIAMGEGETRGGLRQVERTSSKVRFVLRCDDPMLAGHDNLILRALEALREETGFSGRASIDLRKRIPAAAGLGGASSDAAAVLLAARDLWSLAITDETLHRLAARLGSDVPFFLQGGCAVGRGRGDLLETLPVPVGLWFVVVVPELVIPHKTASLYARLAAEDFSDGSRIAAQAARIAAGLPIDPALLGNAFGRPLYSLAPQLADLPDIMRDAGAASVAISGAGPAHYALESELGRAEHIAARLRTRFGPGSQVFLAKPTTKRPTPSRPL